MKVPVEATTGKIREDKEEVKEGSTGLAVTNRTGSGTTVDSIYTQEVDTTTRARLKL